jgi:hypothetical protein
MIWNRILIIFIFAHSFGITSGQELYILNEPASNVPKGVIGLRMFSQHFKEINTTRSLGAFRIMYGLTPRLTVMATLTGSNHHNRQLPPDLITHTHTSGGQTIYFTNNIKRGVQYPFLINGVNLFAKYRFISADKKNEHFRMALYAEWASVKSAHDEAEPNLLDDNSGYGGGLIATWLKNRFAASLIAGFIQPNSYFEKQTDFTGGPDLPTTIYYGQAFKYNLSLGYRLSPKHYTDYNQANWNIYIEFMGKQYDEARVIQNGTEIETKAIALMDGRYLEIHPGIQHIFQSNLRVEASVGLPLSGRSYVHFIPVWTFAVQRYLYRKVKD